MTTDPATTDQTTIDPAEILRERFSAAIATAFPEAADADPLVSPSRQAKLGDFQSNAAMPLAKRVGAKPRDVASRIVEHLDVADVAEPVTEASIAGPGFINVTLRPDALAAFVERLDAPELGIEPPATPDTVVVDLCGVNLAKQMHVGHLRSTVIGDTVARLFERLGYDVIRQSHVGDWGLPIAMVVQALIDHEDAGHSLDDIGLDDLNRIYKDAQATCKDERVALASVTKYGGHPKAEAELEGRIEHARDAAERARQRLVSLQSGDERSVAVWQRIYDVTMAACLATCARLNTDVTDEHSAGESTYRQDLHDVVTDLETRGIAEESDGALVVRVEGIAEPCLIRKKDGGYLYATTDLAAIKRRVQDMRADRVVYVVDARQSLHFRLAFGAAERAGYTTRPDGAHADLEHAAFGTVLGEDNKPLKTRSGENIKLADLLDEAVARAATTVAEKNPELPEGERARIAEAVGIAAIKYTDLSTERIKDYIFSWDRMLAFEGDTGPYLLNAVVRITSIFRKAGEQGVALDERAALVLAEPDERALALTLLKYPRIVRAAGEALEPHRVCNYLYELASAFSGFYERCPVLKGDDDAVRASRLRLCGLTKRVLCDGLETMGIPTLERM